jgi:excisionase family DNA binding protein
MPDIMLSSGTVDTSSSTAKGRPPSRNVGKRWHSGAMPRVPPTESGGSSGPRFLTLPDVAEILSTSVAQVRALVQAGELRYIQIGGRQQYRIEAVELEAYIQRMYAEADARRSTPTPQQDDARP